MTFITRLAVVLVARLVAMLVVHFGLIMLVTKNAFEHFVIRRIHVAGGAALPLATVLAGINAEILAIVIECCRPPRIQRVASRAVTREIQRHVIRIRRPLKIRLMAGIAIHRRAGVAIIDVALIARRRHMRAEQRKARFAMIERRRLPRIRRVTGSTSMRKIRRNVIRISRVLKIALMTRETIHRRAGEAIIDMAQIARNGEMRAG